MTRTVDWSCQCGHREYDALADEAEQRQCPCGQAMEQIWWGTRQRNAQWDDATAVLVFRNPETGEVRYPGRTDAKLPAGFEREHLRSLREVERFEKEQNVRSEMAWFDKGSGRGHDDTFRNERMTY